MGETLNQGSFSALLVSERSKGWLMGASVIGLALFVLALTTMMLPYSRIVEENGTHDLTCLQVPFTQMRAAEIIDSYNPAAQTAAKKLHFPGDTLFPLGYALLYGGMVGLIAREQRGWWLRIGAAVFFFPFAAMIFDWTENLFIVRMLTVASQQSTGAIPGWMPLLGGIAGSIKYVLLSVLTPVYGVGAIIRSVPDGRMG